MRLRRLERWIAMVTVTGLVFAGTIRLPGRIAGPIWLAMLILDMCWITA